MRSLECRVTRQHIDELEFGQRPSERAAAHLSICSGCREFQTERLELRQLVGSLEPVVTPADFEMRLRARIARAEFPAPRQPLFAGFLHTPALAAAALFVVAGGTAVWIAQRNDEPAPGIATKQTQTSPPSSTSIRSTSGEEASRADVSAASDEATKPGPDKIAAIAPKKITRGQRSADYSVGSADPIRQSDQAFVNAPSKPVVFSLEDERGTKKKISLPPVSFGAQSLSDNRVQVSYSPTSRVW